MKNIQSKLWIFGDSFSKGLGLIDDGHQFDLYKGKEKFIWSSLVADAYDLEEMNQALNGISNDMIFDIIKSVYSSIKPHDKVVIGLTKIPRLGVYSPSAKLKLHYNKTPLRDTTRFTIPGLNFGEEWLQYIRNNMEDAEKDTMDTFLFVKEALKDRGAECIIWDSTLWSKFKSIAQETKEEIKDHHWGLEGHADMAKYIINEFK